MRLVKNNSSLAQKILNRIKQFLQILKGTNADSKTVIDLRKAEMLFEKALTSIGKENKEIAKSVDNVLNAGNELDNSGEIRYSYKRKKTASYINKRLDTPTLSFLKNELRKIYGLIDSAIADGIAIEKGNTIFVVDSGIEDGKIDFGVLYYIEIADDNLRYKNMEEINDRAVSKGHVDNEISKKIRRSPDNGSDSSIGRELSKELSDNTRKSENNESRISGKDATDRSGRLKFSLKDSEKSLNEKFSGLKPIQIKDEKEYQSLERELEHRNGNHPSKIDWALTDKYLYIVKDNTYDSFTPIVKIDCKKYQDFFMHLTQMIDYNNYNPIKTIDAWMTEIFDHPDCIEWFNPDPLYNPYKKQIVDNEIATTLDDEAESSNYKNKDSFGRELSEQQIEFFKDSKVRDKYGRLKEVYHGTYGEFYTFDKSLLGTNINSPDAKLGFFFTASKKLAEDYSSQAKSHKMYNLMYKVANGDAEVLKFLSETSNFYDNEKIKRITETKEYSEINKIKELEKNNKHDVFSVYLDIKKPYIEDWNKKMHSGIDMVRAITKALTNGYDGVIIKRVDASVTEIRPASDLYIVFEPNQIKAVTNKAPTKNHDIRFSKKGGVVVNLSNDNVLQNKIAGSTKSKYDVIREYLIESFIGETLTLSDGIEAIMDKSDAKHLAHLSDNKKTATLSRLREVIEKAQLFSVANKVDHKKFDAFRYYEVRVSFGDEEYDILLNVGHSKFKDEYHIYDITKKGSVANESSTRLARSVDYALKNNTSTNIIRNSEENVNTNSENVSNQISFTRKSMSSGEYAKAKANLTQEKVYSKKEAISVVNEIIDSIDLGDDITIKVANFTKLKVYSKVQAESIINFGY